MRIGAVFLALILLLPGCISDDEIIEFNGRDLEGSDTYRFTLESEEGDLWSLDDHKGKVVILVFMFTRCDETCPVTSANIASVQNMLTDDELEKITIVAVTVDWRHDSPARLKEWSDARGYDWPHLTGSEEALDAVYQAYGVGPVEQGDESDEGYDVIHTSPTYILDTELKGRVVWSDFDFPVDLFVEDVRTVLEYY